MKNISELQEKLGNDLDRISKSTLHSWQIKDIIDYITSPECLTLLANLYECDEDRVYNLMILGVNKPLYDLGQLMSMTHAQLAGKYAEAIANNDGIIKVKNCI